MWAHKGRHSKYLTLLFQLAATFDNLFIGIRHMNKNNNSSFTIYMPYIKVAMCLPLTGILLNHHG